MEKLASPAKKSFYKLTKFIILIIVIGFVDSRMPGAFTSHIWYQTVFLAECLIASTYSLWDKELGVLENLLDGFGQPYYL